MPITAQDVQLYQKPIPAEWQVPNELLVEIDALLQPAWQTYELIEDGSDHDHAGRFWHPPPELTYDNLQVIAKIYQKIGWQVFTGQWSSVTQKAYMIQFIPIALREQALRKKP